MPMPIRAALFVAATAVLCLPARAQYLGLGLESNIELTKQDLAIIRSTVNHEVHSHPVGTTAKWRNPESGNYGDITLARKFERNGQRCETLNYTLRTTRQPVHSEHYRLSSCLQPDGRWLLI